MPTDRVSEDEILQTALKAKFPRNEFPSLYKQDGSLDLEEALAEFKKYKADAALLPAAQAAQAKYDNFVGVLKKLIPHLVFFGKEWTNLKTKIDNVDDPTAEIIAFDLKAAPHVKSSAVLDSLVNILSCSTVVPDAFTNSNKLERMACLSELSNRAYNKNAIYAEAGVGINDVGAGQAIANALYGTQSKTLEKGDFVVYRDVSAGNNPAVLYEVTQDINSFAANEIALGLSVGANIGATPTAILKRVNKADGKLDNADTMIVTA